MNIIPLAIIGAVGVAIMRQGKKALPAASQSQLMATPLDASATGAVAAAASARAASPAAVNRAAHGRGSPQKTREPRTKPTREPRTKIARDPNGPHLKRRNAQ